VKLHPDLRTANFVRRLNRFAALMTLEGEEVLTHVANSGRLTELLTPQNPMLLAPAPSNTARKTAYDLALVEVGGVLVSADARLPNAISSEAIREGRIPELSGYDKITREVRLDDSRLDLLLSGPCRRCYVEVKSVTLVEGDTTLFPDAPTARGRRHLATLRHAREQGHRAAVMFVVQRPDANAFEPNVRADPKFAEALDGAVRGGVEVLAYRCAVSRTSVEISDRLPVRVG